MGMVMARVMVMDTATAMDTVTDMVMDTAIQKIQKRNNFIKMSVHYSELTF